MNPGVAERKAVLESIEEAHEADYPEVYLTGKQGLVIGYRVGGYLFWEEAGEVMKTLSGVDLELAEQAWSWLAEDNLSELEALSWQEV